MENTAKIMMAVIYLILLCGCARQAPNGRDIAQGEADTADGLSQKVNSFTLSSVSDDGSCNWQLQGEAADIKEDTVSLKNVRLKSQAKGDSMTMQAKDGLIKKYADRGVFKDNVVFSYTDGTTLSTDKVDWLFKKQLAATDSPVLVKTSGFKATADGARLNENLNEMRLNKNVVLNTDSGTIVRSSGPVVLDYKKNIAVFNKNVSIENTLGRLTSERMIVFFQPSKKAVKRVEAYTNVRLSKDNSVSTSDKAVYFAEEGRAVFTGNPRIFIAPQQLRQFRSGEGLATAKPANQLTN